MKITQKLSSGELKALVKLLSSCNATCRSADYAGIMTTELAKSVFKRCLNRIADCHDRENHSLKLSRGEAAAIVSIIRQSPADNEIYVNNALMMITMNLDKYL